MSKSFTACLVLAALFPVNSAAAAAAADSVTPPSSATHPRHSFFTSNQSRGDFSAHFERTFRKLDSNHDGFITRDEIAALEAHFDQIAAKNAPKREQRIFDRLDADHDGKITVAEASASRKMKTTAVKSTRRGVSQLFVRADANKDGVITRAEFDAAVASGKYKLRHAAMRGGQIARLFDSPDVARQGRISLDEAKQAALTQFDSADVNRDGVLTPDERRQAARTGRSKRPAA